MIEIFDLGRDGGPNAPKKLLILGPPGVGKTHTVTELVRVALAAGVAPSDILVITFTRGAAEEARERLVESRPPTAASPPGASLLVGLRETVCTIHAESWRLIRGVLGKDTPEILGGDEEPESRLEQDGVPDGGGLDSVARRAHEIARQRRVPLEAVALEVAPELGLSELRSLIDSYEATKRAEKLIDFTDMLEFALTLTTRRRRLLIVDEAQDLSPLQWLLVWLWAALSDRIVVVGDADQAVHAWAGADARPLVELAAAPEWEIRRLAKSHRVPRVAHALARAVIVRNRVRLDAPYEPAPRDGIVREVSAFEEGIVMIDRAAEDRRHVFVLGRSRALLVRYATALTERGVPFLNERGPSPLDDLRLVRAATAVIDLRDGRPTNFADAVALVHAAPARVVRGGRRAIEKSLETEEADLTADRLRELGVVVSDILEPSSLQAALLAAGLRAWRAEGLARIVARQGRDVLDPRRRPRVVLTTMHASKGRGRDLVVLDLAAPRLVRRGLGDGDAALEAERRVLYVAITRTSNELVLVRDRRHDLGEICGLPPITSAGGAP